MQTDLQLIRRDGNSISLLRKGSHGPGASGGSVSGAGAGSGSSSGGVRGALTIPCPDEASTQWLADVLADAFSAYCAQPDRV